MSRKRATRPARAAKPSGPATLPAELSLDDRMARYAAEIPHKRAALLAKMQGIQQAKQQLATAEQQTVAQLNELGGEASAVAAMTGKTLHQVLGIPEPAETEAAVTDAAETRGKGKVDAAKQG